MLPVVVITELEGKRHHPELGYFARSALRMLDELRVEHGRLDQPVPVGEHGGTIRVELNHTDADVAALRASGSATTTPGSWRWPTTWPTRASTSRWSARTCRCGSRPRRSASTPRSTAARRSPTPTRATPAWPSSRSSAADLDELYDDGTLDLAAARDLPCHSGPGAALRARYGAGPGRRRQAGPPGARRPRGVRHPRPLGRAADRPGDAARPRGRDRLARRPGRHRQVRAGAVRRARGGPRAPPAPARRRLPPAVRGGRPGARLPARVGVGEDGALGAGRLRHPRRDHLPRGHRGGAGPRHARGAAR